MTAFITGLAVLGAAAAVVAVVIILSVCLDWRDLDAEDLWMLALATFLGTLAVLALCGLCISIGAAILSAGGL